MRLHLVRHGECTWNAEGRLPGQARDVPLTALGRTQAADAAARLAGCGATLLLASDLLRAVQTADVIGAALGLPVTTTPLLREQGRGVLEGRLHRDLVAEPVPEGSDIADIRWGGGESVADVHRRLGALVDQLRARPDAAAVLVSHADALRILLALLDGRGHRAVDWTPWAPAGIVVRELR